MTSPARFTVAPLVVGLVVCLHLGSAAAHAEDTLDLRPLWQEGQVARYRLSQTQVTRAEMHGLDGAEPQETVTEFEGEVTWHVVEAYEQGGGRVEKTVDDLRITLTAPTGEQRTATADRADEMMEPLQQWLGALVGRPLTYEVEADGEIASVRGFEAIQRQAGEMGPGMDERYFVNLARDLVAVVGGAEGQRVGSNWRSSKTAEHQLGELSAELTYQVEGVEELAGVPTVTISRRASLDLTPDLSDLPAEAPEMDFHMREGEGRGIMMFDLSRQEIAGYQNTRTVAAELSFALPDRQITQAVTETTQTEILRIAEE